MRLHLPQNLITSADCGTFGINSKNNSRLTVRFTSEGPEAYGNDYAIDDIALNEVQIKPYHNPL